MTSAVRGGYFPQYPHHDSLPDPQIRTFITNFYHASDQPNAHELWISYFTPDAHVTMGSQACQGEQEVRDLRKQMWKDTQSRKHTVTKVFPALFRDPSEEDGRECELMLFGEVQLQSTNGKTTNVPWAGHAVVKKELEGEREEWKFSRYQIWLQNK